MFEQFFIKFNIDNVCKSVSFNGICKPNVVRLCLPNYKMLEKVNVLVSVF